MPVEIHSALQRRYRQREITQTNYDAVVSRIASDRSYWQLVEVVQQILTKAETLVAAQNIRSLDAIHLASALVIQDSLGTAIPFVSADERQLTAAQTCKLRTIAIG